MSRVAAAQISFADWELMRQRLQLEPLLQAIADFLDEHGALVTKMRNDLRRGLKRPDTGRNGLTPHEVLRSLVLMRVKKWDYRELRERIADGYTLGLSLPAGAQGQRLPACLRPPDIGYALGCQRAGDQGGG